MKKTLSKVAIAAVAGLVVAAVGMPANAGCPGSQLLDATFHYVVSNPNWGGQAGGDGRCGSNGCYDSVSGPPVSPALRAVFWAVGSGNPAIGLGNDSGIFSGGFQATDFWMKQISASFSGNLYHYPAWCSLKIGYNYVVGAPVTWSAPDADGCGPSGTPPAISCTCFMLSDVWNNQGYFATMCAKSDVLGNTNFDFGADFHLAPVPQPNITASARDAVSGDVTLSVGLKNTDGNPDTPAEGVYTKDGCGTGLAGFRVFGAVVPRNGTPTPGQFVLLPRADNTQQGTTGFGGQVAVKADCNPTLAQDLYLSAQVVGEGATPFTAQFIGKSSTRVPCGANLADPGQRGDDPRPDRGRDHSR
jgi:hypothetical protein